MFQWVALTYFVSSCPRVYDMVVLCIQVSLVIKWSRSGNIEQCRASCMNGKCDNRTILEYKIIANLRRCLLKPRYIFH
jgi:hypothetical protein